MDSGASPWGEIQLEALARDELVYAMNEGWATLSEGVGYALCWIGLRAWDRDFAFSVRDESAVPVSDGASAEVARDQALCRSLGDSVLRRFEAVLRQYGVSVNDRRYMQTTQPVSARLVLARISYGDGLYYFEMRRAGGMHAIAVQREGDRYHLFDCHYGHFRIAGLRNFAVLLDRFMRQADYGRVYDKGTFVAGAGAVARWRVLEDVATAAATPIPAPVESRDDQTIRAVVSAR
ncbi:MAG: hypothetical protein JO055_15500 [Alphaproteobacteria bacterium]|nr:hypothetical protein [Alphaproteobacteria bacterium]